MLDNMANLESRGVQLGPIGEAARRNLTRIRKTLGLNLSDVEARMTGERQLTLSALSKIETGGRKIDVDDLVALAAALDVSPLTIIFGNEPDPDKLVQAGGTSMEVHTLWEWALGATPIRDNDRRSFQARSLPWWLISNPAIRVDGVLPETRTQIILERTADGEHQEAP